MSKYILILLLATACAGPKGNTGATGTAGTNGQPCTVSKVSRGANVTCPDGSTAFISNGAQGPQGANGDSTTVTAIPAPNDMCSNGGYVLSFTDFSTGQDTQSPIAVCNGLNGTPGKDATSVSTVQFCPNEGQPSYPNRFPEYGILIGSTLYAIYSSQGGFLTQLPPGEYNSNAIGSSCNFTVNADGSIVEQ